MSISTHAGSRGGYADAVEEMKGFFRGGGEGSRLGTLLTGGIRRCGRAILAVAIRELIWARTSDSFWLEPSPIMEVATKVYGDLRKPEAGGYPESTHLLSSL